MVQDPDIALLAHRIGVKHWLEQDYNDCVYPDVMHSYGLSEKRPVETKRSFQWKLDRDEVRIFRGLGVFMVKIRGRLQDFNDASRTVCMYNHVCVRYMIYHSREAVESNTFLLCGSFPRWLSPGFSLLCCVHSSSFRMGGLVKWAQRGSHRTQTITTHYKPPHHLAKEICEKTSEDLQWMNSNQTFPLADGALSAWFSLSFQWIRIEM